MAEIPTNEKLSGSVERVTYHNPENGYCVLKIKAKGHKELVTTIGHFSAITAGEYIEATGEWTQHKDFGLQFKAEYVQTVHPTTLEGIEKYLGSGMVKGIGPHFAEKLVKTFGLSVFEVIEESPEKLRKVPGIGTGRLKQISEAWKDQKAVRDIMVFLQSHGVSTAKAVRIYKIYGQNAVEKVTHNPYQLARDINGIGFKSADQIAGNLGVPKDSLIRARAGVNHVLQQKVNDGHCALPEQLLIDETTVLLEIDPMISREAIRLEIKDKHLISENIDGENCLYTALLYHCETEVAKLITELVSGPLPWKISDCGKEIDAIQKKLEIQLAPLQRMAVETALTSKVMIITGGPGTGKTTLTQSIISILKEKNMKIALCSPTGRAAKRLSEVTNTEAKTIHRLLGFDRKKGGFLYDEDMPLEADLFLVDEASMVDVALMHHLLKAIPKSSALIVVGDVDQIPSVGPGCVLNSLIESAVLPTVKLTEIFRQAAASKIIENAHKINHGEVPNFDTADKNADFYFMSNEDPENTVKTLVELVHKRIPKHYGYNPLKDIQVLSPMNRGRLGTQSLNVDLQLALNPKPIHKIEKFGTTYATGDKVMVTENDYDKDVFNGDIGFIKAIDTEEQEVHIDFEGRVVTFTYSEMDILSLAYAISIHKSQGSEYPVVIMPISLQHYMMLKRNLIYTGITRGKKLVVLIGQKKALKIAVETKNQGKRWNKLGPRIRERFAIHKISHSI